MAKNIATLYIDDTSLRLMVTDGKRVSEWAELPLESGLVENNVVINEAEVANKIKQLFEDQKIKDKKVMVSMSGLRCLTRPITLPQLPQAMLDEAVRREAERVLPVPLQELYISWQTIPAPEGKTQVFLIGIPRKAADALLKSLQQAGLKPIFMNLKPLLLARVVKEKIAVIVDVQPTEFDIVIMANGIPQPVRTIRFGDEASSWEEKLTTIRNEVDRTITFYNSNNAENALTSDVPVFASGELANEAELCQSLSNGLGHPVLPLPLPLECPEGLNPGHYSANIGLVVQKLSSEAGPSAININALPAAYLPKPISLTNILALPGAVIAIGLLAFMWMLTQSASADIESMRGELVRTQVGIQRLQSQQQELSGDIAELQKKITEVAELQKKITEVEASRDSFTAALSTLEKQSAGVNRALEVATESLSSDVSLSSISYANNLLTISGRVPNGWVVMSYIRSLDSSGRLGEITLKDVSEVADEGADFTLIGNLEKQISGVSNIGVALNSLPSNMILTIIIPTEPGLAIKGIKGWLPNEDIIIIPTEPGLAIKGWSPNEDTVFLYVRRLEASGRFLVSLIPSMTRKETGGMYFWLVLKTTTSPTLPPTSPTPPVTATTPVEGNQVGNLAPDFQLQNLDGQAISLGDFRGKPMLVNFWESWCPSCVKEMPYIQEIYRDREWSDKGLVLLTIDIGESPTKVKEFLQTRSLSLPVLLDINRAVAQKYSVTAIPTTFLIDKNGIIRARLVGYFESKEHVEEYLRQSQIIP